MSNLEQSIAQWRKQLTQAGVKSSARLLELENHLRDEVRCLVAAGETEARAFELAVSRLGDPIALQGEFDKLSVRPVWPVKIAWALWLASLVVVIVLLSQRLLNRKLNFVLCAHVFNITAGYVGGFIAGGIGICYVCLSQWSVLDTARRRSMGQGIYRFSLLTAGFSAAGTILGMPYSVEHWGRYWNWDPKEIGALCVIGWFGALIILQRVKRLSEPSLVCLALGGNIIVSLAWFGSTLWLNHLFGTAGCLLTLWVIAHLGLITLARGKTALFSFFP